MGKQPGQQDMKIATDAVIFTVKDGELKVLLIQMKKTPFTGMWAVPGGLLEDGERTEGAARRILKGQTGVADAYLEQLGTFDDPLRDPRARVVSVAYYALIPSKGITLKTNEKYSDVRWQSVSKLPKLAYDHKEVIRAALARLRAKIEYTNVAWSLLPRSFPLRKLRDLYEVILDRQIDKRNFLKKIRALDLVEPIGTQEEGGAHRPAELYRFTSRKLEIVDIL